MSSALSPVPCQERNDITKCKSTKVTPETAFKKEGFVTAKNSIIQPDLGREDAEAIIASPLSDVPPSLKSGDADSHPPPHNKKTKTRLALIRQTK